MTVTEDRPTEAGPTTRYLVVSTDCHVGPSLTQQLRSYCEAQHLEAFDEDAAIDVFGQLRGSTFARAGTTLFDHDGAKTPGLQDPHARLRELDDEGIACEVVFAGGQNPERLPFMLSADPTLRAAGFHIYNQWLADFCSVEPHRHVGVAQIPIWDIDAAVQEVEWARDHGLGSLNFPAPHNAIPPYNDPVYEPFWSAVEATGMPLNCHSSPPIDVTYTGVEATALLASEASWFAHRAVPYLIWGAVFERHPGVKLVLTEQQSDWVARTLRQLDSIWHSDFFHGVSTNIREKVPRLPSEYFAEHVFIARSMMAHHELVESIDEGFASNFMWGSDMPHIEGTWPNTDAALRMTFGGVAHDVVADVLGNTALAVYSLDAEKLRSVADRIGPSPARLDEPLEELPPNASHTYAFRTRGPYS